MTNKECDLWQGKKPTKQRRGISRNLYLVNWEIMEYFFKSTLCRFTSCQSHCALSWMYSTLYSYNALQERNKNSSCISEKFYKLLKHYPLSTNFMNGNLSSSHSLLAFLPAVLQQLVRFTTNRWTNIQSKVLSTYRERQNSGSRYLTYFLWSCVAGPFKNMLSSVRECISSMHSKKSSFFFLFLSMDQTKCAIRTFPKLCIMPCYLHWLYSQHCASHFISRKSKKDHTQPINFKLLSGVIRKCGSSLLNILKEHFNPFLQRNNNKTNEWMNLLVTFKKL